VADYNIKGKMTLETGSFISSAQAASNSLNGLNTSTKTTSAGMRMLKRGVMAAGVALGGLAAAGIKAASDYQQANIAFTTMLGSAEKSTAFLQEMRDFAAKTPFELPDLLTGARRLMAMGFAAEEVRPMLTAVGDAAAGLGIGAEGVNRITLALGQMRAKGKVSGEEMRQLAEAGIPAWNYLAQAAGKSTAEMMKLGEAGAIPAAEAIQVLIYGMEKGIGTARGFGGMMDQQSRTMAGLMSTLKDTVRNAFVDGFNKYVPAISTVFEKLIPKVGGVVQKIIDVMGWLASSIGNVIGGMATIVKPIFENFLVPALKIVAAVVYVVIEAFSRLGKFMKDHAGVVAFLTNVIMAGVTGYIAYRAVALASMAITKLHTAYTIASTAATTAFTTAQRLLNATMAFNPVALVVGALVALAAGFVIAWNHSETFRKVVIAIGKAGVIAFGYLLEWIGKLAEGALKVATGPLRLLLKGLALLKVPGAQAALDGINKAVDTVGDFFDKAAKKVKTYASALDSLANKKIKLPSFGGGTKSKSGNPLTDPTFTDPTAGFADAFTGGVDEKAKAAAEKLKEAQRTLKESVENYNDFIKNDFVKGFTDGADNARDAILNGLDKLKSVFEAQAAMLEGAALDDLWKKWDAVNNKVRGYIAQAMKVAQDLEDVQNELDKANDRLEEAIANRAEGAKAFAEVLKTPFGEPSQLQKGLASGEATVDSIIAMYDSMREAIDKRFDGIGGTRKDELINYLTDQTAKLVALAKRRDQAAKALEEAQAHLDDVLSQQASFKSGIVDSIKSFGTALADLSKSNGDNTIKVIKTASGLVITQMTTAKSGVDVITDKLKANLQTIQDFTTNIQMLLTKGYNKEYVKQLLEAGPEAAGATAALLAQSGSDTVDTVNSLYDQINKASEQFGTKMSETFYGNAVSMAKAMVDGAQSEYTNIMDQMTSIYNGIKDKLTPLKDVGTNVGEDLIQAMIDKLNARKAELIALAQSIAAAVAAAMQSAAAGIGVGVSTYVPPKTTTPPPAGDDSASADALKELDDANAALADALAELDKSTTDLSKVLDGLGTSAKTATKAVSGTTTYTVKSGDTLSAIAKKAGTTLDTILDLNPKFEDVAKYKGGNMIWSGTTVKLPTAPSVSTAPTTSFGGFTSDSQNWARTSGSTTNVAAGAVTVNLSSNVPADDVEPIMTRALLNALGAR
jgi:tape measure domain-containing protein